MIFTKLDQLDNEYRSEVLEYLSNHGTNIQDTIIFIDVKELSDRFDEIYIEKYAMLGVIIPSYTTLFYSYDDIKVEFDETLTKFTLTKHCH